MRGTEEVDQGFTAVAARQPGEEEAGERRRAPALAPARARAPALARGVRAHFPVRARGSGADPAGAGRRPRGLSTIRLDFSYQLV